MQTILGTAFSLTLGVWRLRVNIAIEDTALADAAAAHAPSCESRESHEAAMEFACAST